MPELPEVETVVRDLWAAGLLGRRIVAARVYWRSTITDMSVAAFRAEVRGCRVVGLQRRGKYIVVALSGTRFLLIHLRMTGALSFARAGTRRGAHDHVILGLDDGRELRFRDPRKFGRWELVRDPVARLAGLGPEPLDPQFTAARFIERLRTRRGMLKPLLLNQAFVAGLGNIYVDEALWEARLHPQRRADSLAPAECRKLHGAIRKVLLRGIAAMGTTLGQGSTNFYSVSGRPGRNKDGLKVFRRTGLPCPRCGSPVTRMRLGQRSTHICPSCQVAS